MSNPNRVDWKPGSAAAASSAAMQQWARAPAWSRFAGIAGTLLVFVLLWGFYTVVQGAVQRAETGRELARVASERKAVCSAFSVTSARDLCAVTVATHGAATHQAPANTVLRAAYKQPAWSARKAELTAALY